MWYKRNRLARYVNRGHPPAAQILLRWRPHGLIWGDIVELTEWAGPEEDDYHPARRVGGGIDEYRDVRGEEGVDGRP